jgi:short subunit dehydrogenase
VGNDRPRLHLVFEALDFELIFPEKDHIIEYAQGRASVCSGGNRILDSIGQLERRWSRRCDRRCCRTRLCARGGQLFLAGRLRAPVEAVAKDIVSAGGSAETAEVDALDEQAVDKHLKSVIDKAGRVDISFNAVGIPERI